MKKIYLSIFGFTMLCRLNAYAQTKRDSAVARPAVVSSQVGNVDSTDYKQRKIHLDEINFVSSYYHQNGNHSAVTGGIGTEKVTDVSNGIELNYVWTDRSHNKNTLLAGIGIDVHSSASQAFVSKTGASQTFGARIYPSGDWTVENAKTGNTFGAGVYLSDEFNYQSSGAAVHYSLKTFHKNGELSLKIQGYYDRVKLIYPSELDPNYNAASDNESYGSSPRETYTASLEYTQVISTRFQLGVLGDFVRQNGYLGLPFHRVYLVNGDVRVEKLPSTRSKIPLGIRANYFFGDKTIIRSYYRYYKDDWGIRSNTANVEVVYKINPFWSFTQFYRYYDQSASKYFAPFQTHLPSDEYYSSNYEYAKFRSKFYGVGFRINSPNELLGWQGLHTIEIRYGHYSQTTELASDVISLNLTFK